VDETRDPAGERREREPPEPRREPGGGRTFVEEFEVSGRDLVDFVRKLLQEGTVRRIILRKKSGQTLLEIPLTAGIAIGGVATLFAPVLVALGAMAVLLSNVSIAVVREVRDETGPG